MCQPASEGGKRCAAHTRPPYLAVMADLDGANKFSRNKVRLARSGEQTNMQVLIDHASTPQGRKEIEAAADKYQRDADPQTAMWLRASLKHGGQKAEADAAVRKAIKTARTKEKRAETLSSSTLKPTKGVTVEKSLAGVYPDIAAQWDTEANGGITPEQVTPYINARVWWMCDQGHKWEARCNNRTNRARNGAKPWCPECHGHRQKSLERMQENLSAFVTAVDDDPDAWNALSPAMQYAILKDRGMLSGSVEGFERATALSMIQGELTLRDVVNAGDVNEIAGAVNEDLNSDDADTADRVIDLSDGVDTPNAAGTSLGETMEDRVDRLMASAGAASLVSEDERLVGQITREISESLWNEVYNNPDQVEEILGRARAGAARNAYRAMVAERFETELRQVQDAPLPEGYVATRTLANGATVEVNPLLSQKRFALMVENDRKVNNWSGTGAGKTLTGVLASRQIGAQETVVVCPLDVIERWRDEYAQAFPDTDIRIGLPSADEDLAATHTGRPRVWIANYDKFSGNPREIAAMLGPLAERLDYAVLDEVHLAKATDEGSASIRHRNLQKFMDTARERNENLAVSGSTATPVVTGLAEAKSLLRLTTGSSGGFGTEATISNATAAYQAMSESGMRWRPSYSPRLSKPEIDVDITDRLPAVYDRLVRETKGDPRLMSHPAYMERALLPEKMDAIVNRVRAAGGPAVVYSDLVTGMVDPIKNRLEAEGYRTARYTGEESVAERAAIIRRFQSGEIDVIVGSRPIATGVDGLQHVARKMVVACPGWTATQDDQMVGRLHRTGQTEDVEIDYIRTTATLQANADGEKMQWSNDDRRLNRIKFRRSLSDAAVDGVIPQGQLTSAEASNAASVAALSAFVQKMRQKVEVAA